MYGYIPSVTPNKALDGVPAKKMKLKNSCRA